MSQIVKLRRSSVSGQKPTNSNLQLGELALNTTDGKVYMAKSGSLGPSVEELISTNTVNTGSLHLVGSITASAFSGSATGLINVPFQISGSDLSGNTYNKQFTKLQFDDSTGLNVEETVPGTAFISIGSHFKDIFVSGSPILSATGSDAFEIIGAGGLGISTSITDTNGNGYVKELTISATSLSSSLNSRINVITGSINGLNNFTSSVVLTSQTSSMTVLSSSYAATASFALNAGGGGSAIGSYTSLVVTSASSTWSFAHNTGQRYPIFQVFDNNGYVVIPSQIQTIDDDNANIIFPSPQTGRVIASLGGGNGTTQPFTSSSLWTVNHNLGTDYPDVTVWDSNRNIVFPNRIESVNTNQVKIYFSQAISGYVSLSRGGHIVTGSLSQVFNFGFANTGSNSFNGNQHISGSITIGDSAEMGSKCVTISGTTQLFDLSIFDGANFDYVVKNGLNMRAGVIMSAWNGTDAVYNESSTMDLGNTSGVTFNVTSTGKLNAEITNGSWSVQVLYRALGCGIIFSTPTPTPTSGPTSTPTPTPTSGPTSTSTPTPTPSPTPFGYSIGDSFGGGKLAYILQPGDPGYISGETHGLIAAVNDISNVRWGCQGTLITGADGTAIGTGNQNTIDIMAGCADADCAARLCGNLVEGGYSDWYLPSGDELYKLYLNRVAIGNFITTTSGYYSNEYLYFSSTETDSTMATYIFFAAGGQFLAPGGKAYQMSARAVRSF